MRLVLASGNPDKLAEFREFLEPMGIAVQPMRAAGFEGELLEDGQTFEQNAMLKAEAVAAALAVSAVGDDSGLVVPALAGQPGLRSARYAGKGATYRDHYMRLLENMKPLAGDARKACFVCALALAAPGQQTRLFRVERWGIILESPRGNGGFGYDPVFFDPELGCTYAEDPAGKQRVSHRAQALQMLAGHLKGR